MNVWICRSVIVNIRCAMLVPLRLPAVVIRWLIFVSSLPAIVIRWLFLVFRWFGIVSLRIWRLRLSAMRWCWNFIIYLIKIIIALRTNIVCRKKIQVCKEVRVI